MTTPHQRSQDRSQLVLGRRQGERLHLTVDQEEILVEVSVIMGSQVRLSITADRAVQIVRAELVERAGTDPMNPPAPRAPKEGAPNPIGHSTLSLGRREGEKLYIYAAQRMVVISIARIKGPQVRIGIEAERDVQILRAELVERAWIDALEEEGDPIEPGDALGNK